MGASRRRVAALAIAVSASLAASACASGGAPNTEKVEKAFALCVRQAPDFPSARQRNNFCKDVADKAGADDSGLAVFDFVNNSLDTVKGSMDTVNESLDQLKDPTAILDIPEVDIPNLDVLETE